MKRLATFTVLLLSFNGILEANSVFSSRGLGQFRAPAEYLSIAERNMTLLEGDFLFEYDYATDGKVYDGNFMVRPERLNFFFALPARFGLSAQITERYNLDFSIQSDSARSGDFTLIRKVLSRGGIGGFRIGVDKSFYDIGYLGIGYERLFGGAWERWDSKVLILRPDSDSTIVDFEETTVDSLLYHFAGNGLWGMAGVKVGPVEVRGFYGFPLGLTVTTELATLRDTSTTDSVSYTQPAEFGGIARFSARKMGLELSYLQLKGEENGLGLVPGHHIQLNSLWKFEHIDLTAGVGYNKWYVQTVDTSTISDVFLSLGTRIPIKSYGYGTIGLTGGLRKGGDLSEYYVELRAGLLFKELWKRRERMWGG
ncbi:hypothetical protein JXM67_06690 [candidate division WOR-3 bacterium]|nr:hypothetical protein [candidate division WOR-3 bacterium]